MIRNRINKISWFKIGSIVLSTLMMVACSDLDENPGEVQLDPTSLSSDAALDALVTGMYRKLQNNAKWSGFFIAGYGGDDITTHSGSNKIGFRHSDWRIQTPDSERLTDAYTGCYNAITIANTAIDAKDNIKGDAATIDRLIGEAYFMRAFAYLHLTRTYGRIPIQLKSNSNEALLRASFEEIYVQIESDLKAAENLLPNVYPGIPAVGVRPNKGSAKAFLSRLYMHWAGYPLKDAGKYALAAAKAKEVIDNAGTYGFALSDDFRGLWTEAGRFSHSEGVFTMVGCAYDCGIGNRTTGRLGLPAEAGGWTETFGEIAFFEDFEATAQTDGTEQRFNDTYILETIPNGSNPVGAEWETWSDPHPILRKVVGGDWSAVNTTNNDINRYFMRYAEVLLNYAEASGRLGNETADAWEALNKVRRRAGATTDLLTGDLAELAFTERKWEFAGEYERWHDLVRMERVKEALENRSPDETVDVLNGTVPATSGEYFYFSPIPQSEIDKAPQLAN
ncbi:RagB/SusD family nutrient uptake outer membrane protein [Aestuariivivens insulae]|uniref:RagB/SusD family nutrient uptake outer membrane protein n=1 Tax=Aestuariivivens insulae TaxID=1621988 RepID=UPI001F56B1DE|nr:RagB/SusD family nutrient uptake outer membrane protein [Aestuariivivens insulae]